MPASDQPPQLSSSGDPWLFTPGPLTTSLAVKQASLHDLGSRDTRFLAVNDRVRLRLAELAGAEESHLCVPVQGSGTFAVEAMLTTLVPKSGKVLLLQNGAYGQRMETICKTAGRSHISLAWDEVDPIEPAKVAAALAADPAITHVALVWCETTTGLLNPLEEVAAVVAEAGVKLLIDAMSAFGALTIDAKSLPFEALAASSNKCLQGIPGLGFVLAEKPALAAAAGNAVSLSLDLHAQWQAFEKTGQWRFTPPVQVILALDQALAELDAEGGVAARFARYSDNCRRLTRGMRALGFETLLPDEKQAPVIVTLLPPAGRAFDFRRFYDALAARGLLIYPGKLTERDSFRIGCIGDLGAVEIDRLLAAIEEIMATAAA